MKKIYYLLLSLICSMISACDGKVNKAEKNTAIATESSHEQAHTTILALGDSLTEGLGVNKDDAYPAQLQAYLHEHGYTDVEVINAGVSGETSAGLLNRLDWVLQHKPQVTILTIGANDAMRALDLAKTEDNIREAIRRLRAHDSDVILGGMQIYDNLGRDYVEAYRALYPRIAQEMNVALIPFFLNGVAANPKLNQQDGIHPTAEGYRIIVRDNVAPAVMQYLEQHQP